MSTEFYAKVVGIDTCDKNQGFGPEVDLADLETVYADHMVLGGNRLRSVALFGADAEGEGCMTSCGSKTLGLKEAIEWLNTAQYVEAYAAWAYLTVLMAGLVAQREPIPQGHDGHFRVEVRVMWA